VAIPSSYLERIRECLPDLPIVTASLNRDGLTNDVIILNRALVVRFPKDEGARADLVHERAILDVVRPAVSLPVPHFTQVHDDLVIYRFLPGAPLAQDELLRCDDAGQDRIAAALAQFLRQLYAIPRAVLDAAGIGISAATRSAADWEHMYHRVERELFPHMMAHQHAWVHRQFAPVLDGRLRMSYEPVLIHGDLAAYHLLYDPQAARLTGVIDFGTGGLGDPAVDYALVIQMLGEQLLRRMARTDPTIAAVLERARFRALALELEWALHGVRRNDVSWLVAHLGNARDARPFGGR
jgi:aminoglycoside 2''-phosphotransferase